MARATVELAGDGLLIEVHPNPDKALSAERSRSFPSSFSKLMDELARDCPSSRRTIS